MKNLLKNNVRSWKRNKISIIGLSFLTFFGLGSYCVLSNTTSNISNQYNKVATQGALHDINVSEMYNVGNAHYQANTAGIVYDYTGASLTSTFTGVTDFWTESQIQTTQLTSATTEQITSVGKYYIPIPKIQLVESGSNKSYVKTYHITLDPTSSTGLYKNAAEATDPQLKVLTSIDLTFVEEYAASSGADLIYNAYKSQPDITKWDSSTYESIVDVNTFAKDFADFNNKVTQQSSRIADYASTTNTPITQLLTGKVKDKEYFKDKLEIRNYKSLNVVDKEMFYKAVESNPDDTIDKMVLFNDTNGRQGNNLFATNDFAPFGGYVKFIDTDGKVLEPNTEIKSGETTLFVIPKNLSELVSIKMFDDTTIDSWGDREKFIYSQLVQIRAKSMLSGKSVEQIKDSLIPILQEVAAISITDKQAYFEQFKNTSSTVRTNYSSYYTDWYIGNAEVINTARDGGVTFTWTVGLTPQTCKIVNWTNQFAIINPQFLKANKKTTIDPIYINNFVPYSRWYKAVYEREVDKTIDVKAFNTWLNTLNVDQINFWVDPAPEKATEMSYDVPGESPVIVKKTKSTETDIVWTGIAKQHILEMNGFALIIWGCGLTPDFVYPVVDFTRPTPNSNTEAVLYCNEVGYNSIKHAYANAVNENYIVGKFKTNLTDAEQSNILKEINDYAKAELIDKGIMSYPKGTTIAYAATDTNNILNTSAIRVVCIPNLVKRIRIITIILSSFIIILCIIICFIIIKRFVEGNRINIGIMRANGFTKRKIALSLIPFAILPALIGGIGAYIIGFVLQIPALLLFKSYWSIPTSLVGFSPASFIGCILLPFLLFSAVCVIATLIVLRTKAVDLMKSGSEFKTNAFSRVVKKPFKKLGIMTRFRVSLAFNSISRLLMLGIVSTLTMSTLVFAMTSYNRLAQSQKINASQFDYKYSFDLTTPTNNGGMYSTINIDNATGVGYQDVSQYWYNNNWNTGVSGTSPNIVKPYASNQIDRIESAWFTGFGYKDTVGNQGTLMLPNAADSTGQQWDIMYLQNKFCSRMLLDYNIGIGSLSSNPWEIALALMPINSRNLAADGYNKMIQKTGERIRLTTERFNELVKSGKTGEEAETEINADATLWYGKWLNLNDDKDKNIFSDFITYTSVGEGESKTYTYNLVTDMSTIGWLFQGFNQNYLKFLTKIYADPEIIKDDYTILYGGVEMHGDGKTSETKTIAEDETYTYVNAKINWLSTKPRVAIESNQEIKIEGIQDNSKFINLTSSSGEDLNRQLFGTLKTGNIPVVVNAFSAHKYRLGIGSTINVSATNTVDRYEREKYPEKFKEETDKFYQKTLQVVGISQGTNGEAFYINQEAANKLVGLPDGKTWNKTHKYFMYTETPGTEWEEENAGLIDLADNGEGKNTVYKFDKDSTEVKSQLVDKFNTAIPVGYNGIYTSDKDGKPLTQIISLYSCSGLWPGTAVFTSSGSNNPMITLLKNGNNLALANKLSNLNFKEAYEKCNGWLNGTVQETEYTSYIEKTFLPALKDWYGDTTMVTSICGAMNITASDKVYQNLISTLNTTETSIMAIVLPITIIIVGIISNLIINDSKKMAAMLKALGYSDMKNIMSILALFIPTIVLGLALAIPLSIGIASGYQAIIFSSANILVNVSRKWWYYAVAVGGIGVVLLATYIVGYRSLKKDRLVDQIK